ncbi:hypothetical protein [Bartonella jaculi]|uniref:Uncharacterized protein n=1 Tax=Bartonella jaculi TaxID=686226 RepID=A0ABP9N2Y5_9HYPH
MAENNQKVSVIVIYNCEKPYSHPFSKNRAPHFEKNRKIKTERIKNPKTVKLGLFHRKIRKFYRKYFQKYN